MRLAMYKGPPNKFWHKIGHKAICLWTRSEYSHCELAFGEPNLMGTTLCASASARDGGVRWTHINLSSGRWDVFDMPDHSVADEQTAREWFQKHNGKGYDYFGLLWFLLPIKLVNNSRRFFCSEADADALGLPKPHKFHPQKLLARVTKR